MHRHRHPREKELDSGRQSEPGTQAWAHSVQQGLFRHVFKTSSFANQQVKKKDNKFNFKILSAQPGH